MLWWIRLIKNCLLLFTIHSIYHLAITICASSSSLSSPTSPTSSSSLSSSTCFTRALKRTSSSVLTSPCMRRAFSAHALNSASPKVRLPEQRMRSNYCSAKKKSHLPRLMRRHTHCTLSAVCGRSGSIASKLQTKSVTMHKN